ncbi:MAG: saccharopine dehydrogenase NADP-binding domain-containing protein [Candidatus Omnitrophica bacterium]|nr:saccharopine dehydrogenase NADP-binding domain-containing protein [Candidatus Omnitrophota bacterium]
MIFKNKVLMIGYGSVARCVLPILLKHISIPYKNITIVDFTDKRKELSRWIKRGIKFFQEKITPLNISQVLSEHVSPGGIIIDLSWNIDCVEMLSWCHENKVLYINTSVEQWDPYADIHSKTPFQKSLYYRQKEIQKVASRWKRPMTTAILDHGANPGLISHFTKKGLADIAQKLLDENNISPKIKHRIKECLKAKIFSYLARELKVKVIHISEHDTQITNIPKRHNEFVGTWSIEGLREEGIAPAEMGWGTHETDIPLFSTFPPSNSKNQIFLSQMGMNTWVRSWVPSEEIIGMVIRHAEAASISDHLTVREKGKTVYCPTVHYAYMPCNETITSLYELRSRNYDLQKQLRIMSDEIIGGDDILGALIMGHQYNSWWTGSVLSIQESRRLIPHQNATTIQVAIGAVSAVMWMLENPQKGICMPDDLPYEYILNIARPYLGKFVSTPSDWTPLKNYQIFFKENPNLCLDRKNVWSFKNFLFCD